MLIMLMLLLLKCNLEEKPEVWVFPEGGVARKSFQVSVQISASYSYDNNDDVWFTDKHESRFGKLTDILGESILLNLASEHRPGWLGA